MKEQLQKVIEQNNTRREWRENDTPDGLATMIFEEAQELVDAMKEAAVTDDPYAIVSEIGDVLYLTLKLCGSIGIDPTEALDLKLLRNSVKYPDTFHSNGWGADEAKRLSKSMYRAMGGDQVFFDWHSSVFPLEELPGDRELE